MPLTFIGEQFRTEIQRPFSLNNLRKGRKPIALSKAHYQPKATSRLNHFMIKLKHSDAIELPSWIDAEISRFVDDALTHAQENDLPVRNRFVYLTMDNKKILKGTTQRTPGWHLDGLQGGEVLFKVPTCYEIAWTNKMPMQISNQAFEMSGMSFNEHNIFDSLGEQVYPESIESLEVNTLYLMNAYQLHRGIQAERDVDDRLFLRLYITELPITSNRMSINELIAYPYPIHTTTGAIPDGLSVWKPEATPGG